MNKRRDVSISDLGHIVFVTAGLGLLFVIGYFTYNGMRAFIRRFIRRMPDWNDF